MRRRLSVVVVLALSLWCVPARAAVVVVANAAAASANNITATTGAMNTTGATLLVAAATNYYLDGSTLSDSKGNVWVPHTLCQNDADTAFGIQFFDVVSPIVGAGHTVTLTNNASFNGPAVAVIALSGTTTSSPFDQSSCGTGNFTTTLQGGSITPSANNEVVLSALTHIDTGVVSINGGFTISNQVAFAGGTNFGIALAYLVQTTATAANPTWTTTGNAAASALNSSWKAAAAGGSVCKANLLGVGC